MSLDLRLKDLLGPLTRVKKKKKFRGAYLEGLDADFGDAVVRLRLHVGLILDER